MDPYGYARAIKAAEYEEFVFWARRPSAAYSVLLRADIGLDDFCDEHQALRLGGPRRADPAVRRAGGVHAEPTRRLIIMILLFL